MYVKPSIPFMASSIPGPPGVNPPLAMDRMPVVKVVNGDVWIIESTLVDPILHGPATPENTRVRFVLAENRFTEPIWAGRWHEGVEPSAIRPGLVHVVVPKAVSSALRRGVYAFSMRVEDPTGSIRETQMKGHFQVEYEPTSDIHDIPYRTGQGSSSGGHNWPDWGDSAMVKRGSVSKFEDLPKDAVRGDVWNVEEPVGNIPGGTDWVWTGEYWDSLGGSITPEAIESAVEAGGYSLIKFDENDNPYVVRMDGDSLEGGDG